MKPLELQDILLEADKVKINADPEKMNQSKMERRRVTDYTEDEDDTVEVNAQDDNDNETNDYTQSDEGDDSQQDAADTEDDQTDNQAEDETTGDDNSGEEESDNDEESEDYTDGTDDDLDNGDTDDSSDDSSEDEDTDYTDEDGGDDDTGDDAGGDDSSDSGDDSDMGDSAGSGTEETDEQITERNKKVKQYLLLDQMTRLYNAVKGYADRTSHIENGNLLFSSITDTVTRNFNQLRDLIYKYIVFYYDKMSYEYNLYSYNYFIEICKVNIELLGKVTQDTDIQY